MITYECVHRLNAGLHRLVHRLSRDNAWGLKLNSLALGGNDGSKTVNGLSEWVKHTAEEAVTDGDVDDGASSLDNISFLNLSKGFGVNS